MKPLISVIVPVFNIRNYIEKCVKSIISQTYDNIEIILVDDGSTDGSGLICDTLAKIDNRIRVVHKSNGGLSDARNIGIDLCSGSYVTLVDGDDMISDEYVQKLFNIITKTNADIAICKHIDFFNQEYLKQKSTNKFKIFSSEEAIKEIITNGSFTTSAWGKLYRRDLFKDLKYPKGRIFEDLPVTWRLFKRSNRIVYTSSQEYFYRQNPSSIMNSKFNIRNLDIIEAHKSLISGLSDSYPNLIKYAKARLGIYSGIQLYKALKSGYLKKDDLLKLKLSISNNLYFALQSNYLLKFKIFCLFITSVS